MSFHMLKRAATLAVALLATGAVAHEQTAPAGAGEGAGDVPLYDNLGDLSYPITTTSALAQRYFDQGLRLTYGFNHAEALRAFQAARRIDPDCALCYWGEAFVRGPNINAPMDAEATNPAVDAIERARERAHHATPPEQALIEALALRYSADPDADRGALNQAYAEAMAEAARRFPDDHEIAVLYIDALMNLSPWDYWEADGVTPKGRIGEAVALAEKVLAEDPEHPGAIHLYIHLVEASADPHRAEPYAEKLADLVPGAGHLVHMGAHIFLRVGRHHDSITLNKKAVEVDEAYLAEAQPEGIYPFTYYPHNIHFVIASAQITGDEAHALEYVRRLEGKISAEQAEQIGWIQAILTSPYFAHAQYSKPDEVLALADPGDRLPFIKGMWHYARGVAQAARGDVEAARTESAHIAELVAGTDFGYLLAWGVPAPDVLRLARHVVEGRIARAQGDHEAAVREFELAVAIQDALPYMEPPFWYYPVRQSLGADLLALGRPEEARQAFQDSLEAFPGNPYAYYGLMEASEALDDEAGAEAARQRFTELWRGELPGAELAAL